MLIYFYCSLAPSKNSAVISIEINALFTALSNTHSSAGYVMRPLKVLSYRQLIVFERLLFMHLFDGPFKRVTKFHIGQCWKDVRGIYEGLPSLNGPSFTDIHTLFFIERRFFYKWTSMGWMLVSWWAQQVKRYKKEFWY